MPRPLPVAADHGRPLSHQASEQPWHDASDEGYPTREGYPTLEAYQNRDNHARRTDSQAETYTQQEPRTPQRHSHSQRDPHTPKRRSNSKPDGVSPNRQAQPQPDSYTQQRHSHPPQDVGIVPNPQGASNPGPYPHQRHSHPPQEAGIERQPSSRSRRYNRDSDATMLNRPRSYVYPTHPSEYAGRTSHDSRRSHENGHDNGHDSPSLPPTPQKRGPSRLHKENRKSFRDEVPIYKSKDFKGHFVAMTGEFVGTFLFLWFALGGTSYALNQPADTASVLNIVQTYYASVVFGISLLANVWVFYRISGGLFNPAVTVGLVVSGQLPVVRGLLLFPVQMLAGICAAALVQVMFPGEMSAMTRLTAGTSVVQGLFIEAFLTALLVITVLMLAAEKSKDTFLAPVGIGLTFFTAELVGIPFTGGSLNPARSFGPDVVTLSFETYHWIYWLGPVLGALLASGYYRMAKALNYTQANPGQDAESESEAEQEEV